MSFLLGLTGSVGAGKSTTARIFAQNGCEVWDADSVVHKLYSHPGIVVDKISQIAPTAIDQQGINRGILREMVTLDPSLLLKIEAIIHPLIRQDRLVFMKNAISDVLVFDIPLLFEKGYENEMDAVVCVSISDEIQRSRVLSRGTMSARQYEMIKSKQLTSDEKCRKSDFIVETSTIEHVQQQVKQILRQIRGQ